MDPIRPFIYCKTFTDRDGDEIKNKNNKFMSSV